LGKPFRTHLSLDGPEAEDSEFGGPELRFVKAPSHETRSPGYLWFWDDLRSIIRNSHPEIGGIDVAELSYAVVEMLEHQVVDIRVLLSNRGGLL
jgi:hypothetical protein